MKKIILMTMIAIMSTAVQAQIVGSKNSRITITREAKEQKPIFDYNRLYLGYANMVANETGVETLHGFKFGYLHGFSILKKYPLYVQAGLELQYGTYGDSYTDSYFSNSNYTQYYEESNRIHALSFTVPASLTYKFTFNNGIFIEPYAGIRFRINALFNETSETTYSSDRTTSYTTDYFEGDKDSFNRFQFGGQFGVNFGYKNFSLNLGYDLYTPIYSYHKESFTYNTFTVGVAVDF